jgi:hypothetical protein
MVRWIIVSRAPWHLDSQSPIDLELLKHGPLGHLNSLYLDLSVAKFHYAKPPISRDSTFSQFSMFPISLHPNKHRVSYDQVQAVTVFPWDQLQLDSSISWAVRFKVSIDSRFQITQASRFQELLKTSMTGFIGAPSIQVRVAPRFHGIRWIMVDDGSCSRMHIGSTVRWTPWFRRFPGLKVSSLLDPQGFAYGLIYQSACSQDLKAAGAD